MGTQFSTRTYADRMVRNKRTFAISFFTIFLLGFALMYWILHMFTVVTGAVECEYALTWLDGWPEFRSGFQLVGIAIGLCFVVWLLRLVVFTEPNRAESLAQLIFLLGLVAAFLAHKAHFFPYGMPSAVHFEKVSSLLGNDIRLEEARDVEFDVRENWAYDYPPPPFSKVPEPPSRDASLNLRLEKIFIGRQSPTDEDFVRLRTCNANYRKAEHQYEIDKKLWDEYWDGFARRYPLSQLSYHSRKS
ncbi:hypothetical protein [Hyphococcus sp.]|uniref:hypothetical protein n=1 Tax=Hyphococcus sp. TaxID=2038636 RepID=UPI0020843A8B|nr:MAG: hypothetical protein DHS20C04_20550 [Marinicaulis sp.]